MKIVKILGGLGNQMFQYAFYLSLLNKGLDAKIDTTHFKDYTLHNGFELEKIFRISPNHATLSEVKKYSKSHSQNFISNAKRKLLTLAKIRHKEKRYSIYDRKVYQGYKNKYFEGYWQNELYFKNIRNTILQNFSFKNTINERNKAILSQINNTNSISIHIRRGDYINHPFLGDICTLDYYHASIKKIKKNISKPVFYFFSDDIDFCKTHFSNSESHFIDWNKGESSYWDMYLMSQCKHNIIANSSFSWWGAWLNTNPNKIVIGPSKWNSRDNQFNVLPENWHKIDNLTA